MEFSCTSYAPSLNDIANTFNDKTACLTSLFKYMQWYLAVLGAIKSKLHSPIRPKKLKKTFIK